MFPSDHGQLFIQDDFPFCLSFNLTIYLDWRHTYFGILYLYLTPFKFNQARGKRDIGHKVRYTAVIFIAENLKRKRLLADVGKAEC